MQSQDHIHIRRAHPGDELVVRELRLQAMRDSPEAFGSTLERELARTTADWQKWFSPGVTLILEASGTPSGLVAGARDKDDFEVVNLMAMWLSPSLRGSGAAARLVAGIYEWARSEGARCVRLEVIKTNARAMRFYERSGFVSTGHETLRARDGEIELRMERLLFADLKARDHE